MYNTGQYKYLLLAIIVCLPLSSYGQYFKKINMKDGLSNPSVLAIYQDILGRMWFGTNEGVNVYDGKEIKVFKSYTTEGSNVRKLMNGSVKQIVGSQQGDIFMLNNGTLIKYDIRKETFKEIYNNHVGAIGCINNKIWLAVCDTIFIHDAETDSLQFKYKLNTKNVWCIEEMENKIWFGTATGLYVMENNVVRCVLPDIEIFKLFASSRNELWIATRMSGLYRLHRDGKLMKEQNANHRVVSEQIRDFIEDDKNNIWFGTFDGLQMYNPYSDTYKVYRPDYTPGSLEHQSVFSLYKDRQGTIWVGSYYGGVNYFNQTKDVFTYYPYGKSSSRYLSFPIVGEMVQDKDHDLWICTDGGGVNKLNRKSATFTYWLASDKNSILHNNAKSITYDSGRDYLYIGTYTGGISRLDRKTGKVHNYLTDYLKTGVGPNQIIYHCLFHENWLYVSSRNGLWRLNPDTDQFQLICSEQLYLTFDIDTNGYIWLAFNSNLYRLKVDDWNSLERMEPILFNNSNAKITRIMTAKDGTVYISTLGDGAFSYHYSTSSWHQYTTRSSNLLSDFCYNIIETPQNNILITCDKGFSIYSPFSSSMFSLELGWRSGISAITDGSGALATADDLIYLGGVDGMISFNEKDLYQDDKKKAQFYFSDLYINNVRSLPHDESGVLAQSLPFTKEIELSHTQNSLTIDFANSNFVEHGNNVRYQYMLSGFDQDWICADLMRVNYTNLSPGKYTLRVREIGSGHDGENIREIVLNICINRPWYATAWAYSLYIFLFAAVIYALWRMQKGRRELSLSLLKEKNEKERIEELNKMKLHFFTNISHEFRTPLTLILGHVEILLQGGKLSPAVGRSLQGVYRNALNLRNLITELLDFRKQEQGYMKLKVDCVDIVSYMRSAYQSFAEFARKEHINYTFECVEEKVDVWVDTLQLQKVMLNLLSNAFKYTPQKKSIKLSIRKWQHAIEISVADTGCGIPQKELSKIFERFYQVDESIHKSVLGSGIGLALTKGIVEAHKGELKVESSYGVGSTFKVIIPLGYTHFSTEELEHSKATTNTPIVTAWEEIVGCEELISQFPSLEQEPSDSDKAGSPIVLLVEDDEEVLRLLVEVFSPSYTVYTATNGQEGFDKVQQLQPDLVVSDVMMPVLSGKEMCYKIKNSLELTYIPVVLLTAQASDSHELEGYIYGADDYITKPFNVKLLLARCGNLLKNKQMFLKKMNRGEKIEQKDIVSLNPTDQKLLDEAIRIIHNNFDNVDFDVNILASELNMGRSKMFGRLKEIVGMTPNELILKLKLEEAVRLLEEEAQYNISEISYQLGFTSPRYFSRCFKAFYGVTPQYYRKAGTSNS